MDKRLLVFTGVAFVAGLVVGAAALAPGGPFAFLAPKTVILVQVENTGSSEMPVRLDVRDEGGKVLTSTTFTAPARSSVEKSVVNLAQGVYVVRGVFGEEGETLGQVRVNTDECPDGTAPLASFHLRAEGGGFSQPPSMGCRD